MGKFLIAVLFLIAIAGAAGTGWFYMESQQLRSQAIEAGTKLAEVVGQSKNTTSQLQAEMAKVAAVEIELNHTKDQIGRLEGKLKQSKQAAEKAEIEKLALQQQAEAASTDTAREMGEAQSKLVKLAQENKNLQARLKSLQAELEQAKAASVNTEPVQSAPVEAPLAAQ